MAKRIIDEEIDEDFILASMNTMALSPKPGPSLKKDMPEKEKNPPEKPVGKDNADNGDVRTTGSNPTSEEKPATDEISIPVASENGYGEQIPQKETLKENVSKESIPKENAPKEEPRRRKTKCDYESLFIRETSITGRREKTTYLRSKYYRKILDIILCYDNPGLSVFGYIDTVLSHHFEQYGDDIKEILKRRFEEV